MLPAPQSQVCLSCHGTRADRDALVAEGILAGSARPPLLSPAFSQPFTHEISQEAYSRFDGESVVCTSCHSPHRGSVLAAEAASAELEGRPKPSPRNPGRFEYELCGECHGSGGVTAPDLLDLSRLTSPHSRSFHPIEAPTSERSPSVASELRGKQVSCTDCHGNSDPSGPPGPHGSAVRHILVEEYSTLDGREESRETYALCYSCHERSRVLDSTAFPLHRGHVVDQLASCATCHSPHGSVENRALIRFGEETLIAGVEPSLSTGALAFVSESAGSGACYLTCHGVDHAPESYGFELTLGGPEAVPRGAPPGFEVPSAGRFPRHPPGRAPGKDKPKPPR